MLSRAALIASATVSPAAIVCASADLSLDPTTAQCVPLFQLIERGVQSRNNCLGLISEDDQFDSDLFV